MCKRFLPAVPLLFLAAAVEAQIEYRLTLEQGPEPLWVVDAILPNVPGGELDFWIPRWTAGAYHLADFGRFVLDLEATGASGEPLDVERVSDSHFRIESGSTALVQVHYAAEPISSGVFTHGVIDVESNRIRPDYAFVNPASLFGFVPELLGEEIVLEVVLPNEWETATVLAHDERGRFRAPNYLRFEDSPLLFSPALETSRFEVEDKPHAVTVFGRTAQDTEAIAAGCELVVKTAAELMEGLPYERYHFLIGFVPEAQGSGLEHGDSTLILVHAGLDPSYANTAFWGIVAHEFFHLWTPERIHVEGLHPPDYTRPFATGTIWLNEGVTEYFTRHVLLHAGFLDEREMLAGLTSPFPGSLRSEPWTEVSRTAANWTEGAGIMTFATAMYHTGPKVILGLDLAMRRASNGERGMIDFVRFLDRAYAERDRGFPEDALVGVINGIAQEDLTAYYSRFIDGREFPDLAPLLEVIGFTLEAGRLREVEEPSAAQLRARADFLTISD